MDDEATIKTYQEYSSKIGIRKAGT